MQIATIKNECDLDKVLEIVFTIFPELRARHRYDRTFWLNQISLGGSDKVILPREFELYPFVQKAINLLKEANTSRCLKVLVKTGAGQKELAKYNKGDFYGDWLTAHPDYIADDIHDAVRWILSFEAK